MKTLYKWTNTGMSGWEFVLVDDKGNDGTIITGNTASTAINYTQADLTVVVANKKELKNILERLNWLGKYSNLGNK